MPTLQPKPAAPPTIAEMKLRAFHRGWVHATYRGMAANGSYEVVTASIATGSEGSAAAPILFGYHDCTHQVRATDFDRPHGIHHSPQQGTGKYRVEAMTDCRELKRRNSAETRRSARIFGMDADEVCAHPNPAVSLEMFSD